MQYDLSELSEELPEVDIDVVRDNIEARNQANQEPAWTVADTQPLDLEKLLLEDSETESSSVPSNLRPPTKEGRSEMFGRAIDQYIHEVRLFGFRSAQLTDMDRLILEPLIEGALETLKNRDGETVIVMEDRGGRNKLTLNLWLALLIQGHATELRDAEKGISRLIVHR